MEDQTATAKEFQVSRRDLLAAGAIGAVTAVIGLGISIRAAEAATAMQSNQNPTGVKTMASTITTRDGVEIYYKDWGPKTGQPVVLSHGWPLNADAFTVRTDWPAS